MQTQGLPVSIAGVARCYADFLDLLIADERDSALGTPGEGMAVHYTTTVMKSEDDKTALARSVLGFVRQRPLKVAAS
jgi:LPPG:FO 2-phospho-L-lactate transferase